MFFGNLLAVFVQEIFFVVYRHRMKGIAAHIKLQIFFSPKNLNTNLKV